MSFTVQEYESRVVESEGRVIEHNMIWNASAAGDLAGRSNHPSSEQAPATVESSRIPVWRGPDGPKCLIKGPISD